MRGSHQGPGINDSHKEAGYMSAIDTCLPVTRFPLLHTRGGPYMSRIFRTFVSAVVPVSPSGCCVSDFPVHLREQPDIHVFPQAPLGGRYVT